MHPDPRETDIRRYLLGVLPEPDAEALEHEYFARPDALERVRAVEDDLLDDYAAGRLGPGEKEPFERRYLASPPLRQRVVAARALHLAVQKPARPPAAPFRPAAPRWVIPIAIAAGVVVAVFASWPRQAPAPDVVARSAPPTTVARSEGPTPSPVVLPSPGAVASPGTPRPAPAATRLVLALSPVLLRGQSDATDLHIPPGTSTVVLELEGDSEAVPPDALQLDVAIVTVEGAATWSGRARRDDDPRRTSRLASVTVPAARLAPGDYLLTLSAHGQPVHRYFLRVRRNGLARGQRPAPHLPRTRTL